MTHILNMIQREQEYLKNIFTIFKNVSFHEIYMESARQDLCKDEHFDPRTAFSAIDSFKHNRIIPYELYSYFEMHQIESTVQQCQEIIKSLNKSTSQLTSELFYQMILPRNTTLKNLATTRYQYVKIDVGSYSKLNYVKQHTEHIIALFLQKQLNFCRQFLFMRQQFCRKWGADIYTMLQKLFSQSKIIRSITFQRFNDISRSYGFIFNPNEFYCLWKRSKKQASPILQSQKETQIFFNQLHSLLLVGNFNTKGRYGLQRNIPIQKAIEKPIPSYSISHWREHQKWEKIQKCYQLKKIEELSQINSYTMKYKYIYPQSLSGPSQIQRQLNQKSKDWEMTVNKMSNQQLTNAYLQYTKKNLFY